VRNYEKLEGNRLVHRLELSIARDCLRQLGVTAVRDLRAVSWSEEFFDRLRIVAMQTDGIRDMVLWFFPELASFLGVNEALTHFPPACRKRIRRRFVDVPALTCPIAEALSRFEAQLRGSARPLPRPEG
jgi:hypothetical protein